MVAATEDVSTMPSDVQQAKEQIVTTTATTEPVVEEEEPRDDDDVVEREDEDEDEEAESTTEEAEQRQPSTPKIKKFGFGAGMRMYAKSLAEAEKLVVVEPAVEDKELETTTVPEEKPAVVPGEEEAAGSTSPEVVAPEEDATAATEEVVEVLSEDEQHTSSVKSTGVVTACGSIYQQFVDGVTFFLRKTEDGLDDVHEKVCARDIRCAADLDNEIVETDKDDGETSSVKDVEETEEKEVVPPTTESDASPVESN